MEVTVNYFNPKNIYTFPVYKSMLQQTHLLIGGTTGSGKSVIINGIIYTAISESPASNEFIFIDPKRVELSEYRFLPHTLYYASEPETIISALNYAIQLTEKRYKQMQLKKQRKYNGSNVYVIIDELADLMTTNKRQVMPILQRLAQIGRAANVHIIAATQCPLATVIPTQIKVNFDSRVALRTRSAQDSRNLISFNGCEKLPKYGKGYYMTPDSTNLCDFPMYDNSDRQYLIKFWNDQRHSCFLPKWLSAAVNVFKGY